MWDGVDVAGRVGSTGLEPEPETSGELGFSSTPFSFSALGVPTIPTSSGGFVAHSEALQVGHLSGPDGWAIP